MNFKSIIYKSKITLDKEQHDTILYEIELVNLTRAKILLAILFVVEIIFIFTNDIRYLINPTANIIWKDYGYFIVHLLLLSTCIIGLVIIKKFDKVDTGKRRTVFYNYFTPAILVIYLVLTSFLDGLDQLHIRNINSLFIANLLICGGAFIFNFPKNLFTYTIPFLGYIGVFSLVNSESNIIISHLINDLIFLFAVIVISTSMYNYQYEVIAENIILEKTNKLLNYVSNHDPLTGLINRRCFMDQLRSNREGEVNMASLVLVDIDFFKNINDFYGHPVGDMVLKMVSSVLMKYMKEGDFAARWGGEEFLLFLDNVSAEEAYTLTDTLRKDIEELMLEEKDFRFQVTASFGIATFVNESENSFYTAYKAADLALYQAKHQGRNRVVKEAH
jgi:diguanylate cyclase (GGDEF) domain